MAQSNQPKKRTSSKSDPAKQNPAGLVILQWLSYAFWAWLALGLIWLVNLILSDGLVGKDASSTIPYALAASIVLLPTAFVVDKIYRKHEPIYKQGAPMVVMVIHAVLYALVTIGTLIGAVFIALNMFINDSLTFNNGESIALYTTLFASLITGFILLRVLNPFKTKLFGKLFGMLMLVISSVLIVLGFVGPALNAFNLRNDRLIEMGLGTVTSSIAAYVQENEKLPGSLKELNPQDESAVALIEKGLVVYKPEGTVIVPMDPEVRDDEYIQYRYQLCVTFDKESQYPEGFYGVSSSAEIYPNPDGYQSYPDTYRHTAGEVCYKLLTYGAKDMPIGL